MRALSEDGANFRRGALIGLHSVAAPGRRYVQHDTLRRMSPVR
jgi:hypothetical protein